MLRSIGYFVRSTDKVVDRARHVFRVCLDFIAASLIVRKSCAKIIKLVWLRKMQHRDSSDSSDGGPKEV